MKIEELAALVTLDDARVPDVALAKFEDALGYDFPDDYRSFLQLSCGGGRLGMSGPEYVEFKKGRMLYSPETFFRPNGNGYHSIRPLGMNFSDMGREVDGVPDGIFTIGDDGCGNFFTIDLRPSSFGSIGFVDHETFGDHFEDDETYEIMAESFSEFVARCRLKREALILILGAGAPIELSDASEIGPHIAEASRTRQKARLRDGTGSWMEFQPLRHGGHVYRTYSGSPSAWQAYYPNGASSDPTIIAFDHAVTLFEGFLHNKAGDIELRWKQLA
jgi:hypothetical protein